MRDGKISLRSLNKFLFCLVFIFKTFTDVFYVAQNKSSAIVSVKYLLMLMSISISFILFQRNDNRQYIFREESRAIFLVVGVFSLYSFIRSIITMNFSFDSIVGLMYIFLAIVYAFCILNTLNFEDIHACMKVILVVGIIGYICEIGLDNFTVINIMKSSFSDSYSPFESNFTSSLSIIMCSFFAYYRKDKKWLIASVLFTLFTFKRSYMLFAIVYFILPIVFNPNKRINKYIYYVASATFVLATFGIIWLYLPQNQDLFIKIFGVTASKFSSGRSDLLRILINGDYISSGYESSTAFLGRGLEMELVKIYFELGVLPLIIFVFSYFKISKNNWFCFLIMLQNMINFLTSHSLSSAFNWSLRFIIIGCILYKEITVYQDTGILFLKKTSYKNLENESR